MSRNITITIHKREGLPADVHGAVTGSAGQYTILINAEDEPAQQLVAFLEEMTHIYNGDLETGENVQEIEARTRRQLLDALDLLRQEAEQ